MNFKYIQEKFAPMIKVISTVLISSAIGLELWNIYAITHNIQVPSSLTPIFWFERFAVSCHLVEAMIAGFYAPSRKQLPIKYATYTFFVGTVGLLELFNQSKE
ncbi:hypothetical protein IQ278_12300 [Tolypothrix sp. LEGE 11397]|nr:hypothetical protein FDUTEX481_10143 [Tolypothrix sp. PCC 7601]MBE9082896.1 hypothetical protein [Tolypothrix sp. LEGE 11397]UYD27246.1 hypothetical protein HGR01_03845 [Tolypothrix sp. PCC 7712]UYD36895.1 hypothetical protein HG267_14895 [Tolypothrix sp. PCC 7601]BAY93395.1 hypothetical protein NIES3275_54340 [Microchaete diplosiphon NIES-3275]